MFGFSRRVEKSWFTPSVDIRTSSSTTWEPLQGREISMRGAVLWTGAPKGRRLGRRPRRSHNVLLQRPHTLSHSSQLGVSINPPDHWNSSWRVGHQNGCFRPSLLSDTGQFPVMSPRLVLLDTCSALSLDRCTVARLAGWSPDGTALHLHPVPEVRPLHLLAPRRQRPLFRLSQRASLMQRQVTSLPGYRWAWPRGGHLQGRDKTGK